MRSTRNPQPRLARGGLLGLVAVIALVAVAALVGYQARADASAPTAVRADLPPLPAASVNAARKAARAIVHGKRIGGTVDFLGVVTGTPADALLAALKPFEEATGAKVNYEATFSQQSILQTRVQAGNPPDVVFSAYPVQLIELAKAGKLTPLNRVLDMKAVTKQYPKRLLDLGTVNGKLYAFFSIVNYHALVWYNRKAYTGPKHPSWARLQTWTNASARRGKPPWCLGIESGAATGWPAANEVLEALFVRRYGPALTTKWVQGKLAWTSRQVRWAWQTFGSIFTDPKMVTGGAPAIASTNFLAAGNGMYANPPSCYLLPQAQWYGSYAPAAVQGVAAGDTGYFPFPSITPAYAQAQMVDGNQVAVLRNRTQGRALAAYMSTPQFQTLLAQTGQFLVPNRAVAPRAYPTALSRSFAASLVASKAAQANTILLPSVLFPPPVLDAFFKDLTSYIQNPRRLDSYLTHLETVTKKGR